MNELIPDGPKKKYLGQYVGQVVSVSDPDSLMRVRVRVHPLFAGVPVDRLPWAEYLLPVGARPGNGIFAPVKVNDWVWVDFPFDGDSRRPRVVGSAHFCPGYEPNLPHDVWVGPAVYQHQRTGLEPVPAAPGYHDGAIVLDENGALVEIGADGAIRVTSKESGSAIEIRPDGKITVHCEGDVNVSATGDVNAIVGGDAIATIAGTMSVKAPSIGIVGASDGDDDSPSAVTMLGNFQIAGNVAVDGNISATGSVLDSAGNTNHHSHEGSTPGGELIIDGGAW